MNIGFLSTCNKTNKSDPGNGITKLLCENDCSVPNWNSGIYDIEKGTAKIEKGGKYNVSGGITVNCKENIGIVSLCPIINDHPIPSLACYDSNRTFFHLRINFTCMLEEGDIISLGVTSDSELSISDIGFFSMVKCEC